MKQFILGLFSGLSTFAIAAEAPMPEAWRNVMYSNAAQSAANDYANNRLRCVWAGDKPAVASFMPANASFQLAIAGSEASVTNVQRLLDEASVAIFPDLRARLAECHLLAPTLQWLVRTSRLTSLNSKSYLHPTNHPAAFREGDLNAKNLLDRARKLTGQAIPPLVSLRLTDEIYRNLPTAPTIAGVDYPGFQPETTFATTFGIGLVLRAPEAVRNFRVRATTWPNAKLKVTYSWVVLSGNVRITYWPGGARPCDGYGLIRIDRRTLRRNQRIDVAVFAMVDGGFWGPPSILSFYVSPFESRTYAKDGTLQKIHYLPAVKDAPPYDISPICLPADWIDYYQYDEKRRIFGFNRSQPGGVKMTEYSNLGEIVIEHHPNDTPKVAAKVRYFEEDGKLRFEETDEEVTYKLSPFAPRMRGE